MLQISVPLTPEEWDEKNEVFIEGKKQVLQLEHSLDSLSKWESKWCKPFLHSKNKTDEEILDYIKYMTLNQVDPEVYKHLTPSNIDAIRAYIGAPMTATTFSDNKNSKQKREVITAEIIYYWMIALNIPFECQYWHLSKLTTLIRVCNIKNQAQSPKKNKNTRDAAKRYAEMNAARKRH